MSPYGTLSQSETKKGSQDNVGTLMKEIGLSSDQDEQKKSKNTNVGDQAIITNKTGHKNKLS